MRLPFLITTLAPLASLALLACTANPVTERPQLMLVSGEKAAADAAAAYAELLALAEFRHALNVDRQMVERVRVIASRLISQAALYRPETGGWQWEVNVFLSDVPNAFCLAGGKIGIHSGLLLRVAPTDDELAQVIGHEIAHAISDHGNERASTAMASSLTVRVLVFSQRLNNVVSQVLKDAARIGVNLPNSRLAEAEADRIGMLIAAKAGFDPRAAITLWEKIGAHQVAESSSFLSTHPLPAERIAALQDEADRLRNAGGEVAPRAAQDRP